MNNETRLAEMQYYFLVDINNSLKALGMASFYGPPNKELYKDSSKTYWTVQHLHDIQVVDIKTIDSVVMMAPDPRYPLFFQDGSERDQWYLMQKPGKKLAGIVGFEEPITDE